MTADIDQESRLLSINTPLGENVLILQSLAGSEAISELYSYQCEMLSTNGEIAPADLISENVTITLKQADGTQRFFNGFVREFTGGVSHTRELRRYRAEVVPWLWFLTRSSDCRIFQFQTFPQIIEQLFEDFGRSDYRMDLQGNHPEHEYCVQYRETAFDFISRLMEEEGMFYWFEHEEDKHTLVIADHIGAYSDCPENEIEYYPGTLTVDHIAEFEHHHEYRSGHYAETDFDFMSPGANLATRSDTLIDLPHISEYELYDYPGEYVNRGDGEELTRIRMEEEEVPYDVARCVSGCRSLFPGGKFTLTRHEYDMEQDVAYVIVSIQHLANDYTHLVGGGKTYYENRFESIPDEVVFRPGRITPRPMIRGPQTAIVVGPADEEIYTDEYGRVKVQFHWDRQGQYNENSSCWMRVAQVWAGRHWGGMMIPRIGQEVIVDFLEGDPDRPIITGRVYNGDCMPPYGLPDNATMTTVKSNSSKGGEGFNEFRFEDKKGEEQVFLHAEKNLDVRAKNDRFETIGHDRNLVVESNKKEHVKNDRHELIDNHHHEKIGGDRNLDVGGKEAKAVGGSLSLSVADDVIEVFRKNHSEQVTDDYYVKASNVVIEGTTNVTVKVGQSYLAIEASGVKIGTMGTIELEATGQVKVKGTSGVMVESPATAEIKSTSTTVKGDAMLILQGGVVKIN